jgi:hypothetical protein
MSERILSTGSLQPSVFRGSYYSPMNMPDIPFRGDLALGISGIAAGDY